MSDRDLLAAVHAANTDEEQIQALKTLAQRVADEKSDSLRETVAMALIQEVVAMGTQVQDALHACLSVCGPVPALSAAVQTLRDASSRTIQSRPAIEASLSTIYRLLCVRSKKPEDVWVQSIVAAGANQFEVDSSLEQWTSLVLVLPSLIANACQASQIRLPAWAVQGRYRPRLVECAISMVLLTDETQAPNMSVRYLGALVQKMLRHGGHDYIAHGLSVQYERLSRSSDADADKKRRYLADVFRDIYLRQLTARESALLCQAMIRHTLTLEKPLVVNLNEVWSHPWLELSCLPALKSSRRISDALVRLLILSPSSVQHDENVDRTMCHIVASLLASIDSVNDSFDDNATEDDSSNGSDAEEDHDVVGCDRELRRHLNGVSLTWSQTVFVQQTDDRTQSHVTFFLLSGITLLSDSEEDPSSTLVGHVMEGITQRLGSHIDSIRKDGMYVAMLLAKRLGQELEFDELVGDKSVHCATLVPEKAVAESNASQVAARPHRANGKVRGRLSQRDSDAEHGREEEMEAEGSDASEGSDDSFAEKEFDDDSLWDEEEVSPYDLDDDEEDLLETPRPLYLKECLELLRTSDSDDHAHSRHEAALKHLPKLVRCRPVDLPDVGSSLATELLRMENKFDLENFEDMLHSSLVALSTMEPHSVGLTLIGHLFDEHGSLLNRLTCLTSLSEAALELCGEKQFEALRRERNAKPITDGPRVSGKRFLIAAEDATDEKVTVASFASMTLATKEELRTRRWGRSRRETDSTTISNNFGQIAPVWFYSLIGNFIERRDNKTLWGGTNGATLLARLFVTLAIIVECSGVHPGTDMMAKDLFELAWGFRDAEVAELRTSVLCAVAASVRLLRDEAIIRLLLDKSANVPQSLQLIAKTDTNKTCRDLASMISAHVFRASSVSVGNPIALTSRT